jgi:thymidylate synthase (FAD)
MNPDPAKLERHRVTVVDDILGQSFSVLDQGFVRVIDYMGCDAAVVQAARVSYGIGTKRLHEDRGLIRYLMRNSHTTPFEMCELKLHLRVPMDTWRQWIRHRTANVNEYSTRYSVAIDACQSTRPDEWREQTNTNRQGSGGFLDSGIGRQLTDAEKTLQASAREVYEERLRTGVAREQARKDLPLSTYTEAYWKVDLHNLLHFLALRMDIHAQREIRSYAEVIGNEIVARWCPITWDAFVDYRLKSRHFSRIELEIISALVAKRQDAAVTTARLAGWLDVTSNGSRRANRERSDLEIKLIELGYTIPWHTH